MKVGVVVNCSTPNTHVYFLPSYIRCSPGYEHDLIVVHRNFQGIDQSLFKNTSNGSVVFVNKIFPSGEEVPYRAFGSYKYCFDLYKDKYDCFIFMVDHCVIRRHSWILDAVTLLNAHPNIGFLASQIFNGHKRYPHPSHSRTPCLIAKTVALASFSWTISSDHDGEMAFADNFVRAGYIGLQIGNKLNFAYDSLGDPIPEGAIPTAGNLGHITHILERRFFPEKKLLAPFTPDEYDALERVYEDTSGNLSQYNLHSTWEHIGVQNAFIDLEPFHALIYEPSLPLCLEYFPERVRDRGNSIFTLKVEMSES
jgi:hypothetical protein